MTTDTIHAEWAKLRSLRSTWTALVGSTALALAFAAIIPMSQTSEWANMSAAERADFDPVSTSLIGVLFASLFLGSLAVRMVTGEYTTGMIRLTFAAMPHRRTVFAAKAAILAGLALLTSLAANAVSIVIGERALASIEIGHDLWTTESVRAVLLGAIAVAVVAVLGVGLGGVIRRTAPATALLVTLIIGNQLFSAIVPEAARPYAPGAALQAAVTTVPTEDLLAPLPAVLVLAGYAALALIGACVLVGRRDA